MTHRVLCLDGGGSKGVYTLGVLEELEKMLGGTPLFHHFDAVYGTSAGSIIAGSIAVGLSAADISKMYFEHIPKIMGHFRIARRDQDLRSALQGVLGERTFDACTCRLGIVATDVHQRRPLVFKSHADMAHARKESFVPGFGTTMVDAIVASCSAFPLFSRKSVALNSGDVALLMDGGFVANNPSMIAYVDAISGKRVATNDLVIISVGVGQYPETTPLRGAFQGVRMLGAIELISTQLAASSNYIGKMFELLSKGTSCVRISESFADANVATNLLERDVQKLRRIQTKGRESFASHEARLKEVLG